jgi:hypothetical protein
MAAGPGAAYASKPVAGATATSNKAYHEWYFRYARFWQATDAAKYQAFGVRTFSEETTRPG